MRPDASDSGQISSSTIVRAARSAGSHPHLASILLQGRKSANIYASSGVIRGIPVQIYKAVESESAGEPAGYHEVRRRDDADDALRSGPDPAGAFGKMVLAQGLGDEDRQASRDEKDDRGAGASAGRDHAPHLG